MNKMVRQQVFMTAEQKKRLKSRAALTGTSISELVRRGIDRELEDKAAEAGSKTNATGDWKEGWRQAFGMWKDRDDIDELMLRRRKRRRKRREETLKLMRDG
jgi:hypothetical protein